MDFTTWFVNQLLDAFKDESKVTKSYILAVNALAGVIVPTKQSKILSKQLKKGMNWVSKKL